MPFKVTRALAINMFREVMLNQFGLPVPNKAIGDVEINSDTGDVVLNVGENTYYTFNLRVIPQITGFTVHDKRNSIPDIIPESPEEE